MLLSALPYVTSELEPAGAAAGSTRLLLEQVILFFYFRPFGGVARDGRNRGPTLFVGM